MYALVDAMPAERPDAEWLPRLATGVGGLAWSDVEPLVRQHLGSQAAQILDWLAGLEIEG